MKILSFLMVAGALAVPLAGMAQERTVGGSLSQEANWTALKNMVDAARGVADTARTTAQDAKNRAINAQATADDAVARANAAQTTANSALALSQRMEACGKKEKIYAPGNANQDAGGCIPAGGLAVGTYTVSINGANGYAPNVDHVASKTIFVAASSYGGGGESCPVSIAVNGVTVAQDYAIRYKSGVSAIIPAGASWRVTAAGGNCSSRQTNVSVLPLAN